MFLSFINDSKILFALSELFPSISDGSLNISECNKQFYKPNERKLKIDYSSSKKAKSSSHDIL